MRDVIDGFMKEAALSGWEIAGAIAGGGAGALLARNAPLVNAGFATAIGASTGYQLGAGLRALSERPDFSDLTPAEIAVIEEDAERLRQERNMIRARAIGTGALLGVLGGVEQAIAYVPGATVAPYVAETRHIQSLTENFRRAHAKAKPKRTGE